MHFIFPFFLRYANLCLHLVCLILFGDNISDSQSDADSHQDLRRFLNALYMKANLPATTFDQQEIVSRCVHAFVSNGFEDEQSVVEACEVINADDLSLKTVNIPLKLIAIIYKTILELRKPAVVPAPPVYLLFIMSTYLLFLI